MDHVTGMEVAEAVSDVGQLVIGSRVGRLRQVGHPRVSFYLRRGVPGRIPADFRQTSNSKWVVGE